MGAQNSKQAEGGEIDSLVKVSALQRTLGDMRAISTSVRAWAIMGVVVLILGISGPFQTFEYFPLGARLAYWTVMGVASFGTGMFFATWSSHIALNMQLNPVLKFFLTGLASGVAVSIVVILLNVAVLGEIFYDPASMLFLALYCIGISMAIAGLFTIFQHTAAADRTGGDQQSAAILDRLPLEKRAPLISMTVADHYVEVATQKGRHLVLMRLGDAIAEAKPAPGLQIHRSHWVALSAISTVARRDGKVVLTLVNGSELPASRSFIPALKAAGLLL